MEELLKEHAISLLSTAVWNSRPLASGLMENRYPDATMRQIPVSGCLNRKPVQAKDAQHRIQTEE
jgi:hypothetical protein